MKGCTSRVPIAGQWRGHCLTFCWSTFQWGGFQSILMHRPMWPYSMRSFSAEKAQVFNGSSKCKNIANFPSSAWIVKAKTLHKIVGGAQCNYAICGSAHVSVWIVFLFFVFWLSCQALITVHQNTGWSFWLALLFSALPHPSRRESGFFFFPTARDWHCTEMQNNNPLITWVLPVLGFICNGCESPQCLVITAFDLGNNVFTVALLRAQRQCSFNPQCILVESHYTKTTRVLL